MAGNLGAIEREAGTVTRAAILDLQTRLRLMDETFSRIVRNATVVANHSALQQLDYASSGHTGFTSSASFSAHTGAANHPYLDAIETWTAVQTFTPEAVFNGGIDLGTSGRIDSNVADAVDAVGVLIRPTVPLTSDHFRNAFQIQNSAGSILFSVQADGSTVILSDSVEGSYLAIPAVATLTTKYVGLTFNATFNNAGQTLASVATSCSGGVFAPSVPANPTQTSTFGAVMVPSFSGSTGSHTNLYGAVASAVRGVGHGGTQTTTNIGGFWVTDVGGSSFGTVTNACGILIDNFDTLPAATLCHGIKIAEITTGASTGKMGILLSQTNTGYKALAIRDANAYINSDASGDLDLNASTNIDLNVGGTRYANFNATTLDIGNPTSHSLRYTLGTNVVSFNGSAALDNVPSSTDTTTWTFTSNRSSVGGVPDAFTFRAAGANANITEHTKWLDTSSNVLMTLSKAGVLTVPQGNTVVVRDTGSFMSSDNANEVDIHAATAIDLNINSLQEIRITALSCAFRNGHDISFGTGAGSKIGTGTTQKIGFWNVTPVVQPGPFTQTAYSTATHTVNNVTATAVATTAATNSSPYGYTTAAQADDIITQLNNLIVDVANVKQVLNAVVDDGQLSGIWS